MSEQATPRPWPPEWGESADGETDTQDAIDARFILRAVNAHDDLVAALRALVDVWDAPRFFARGERNDALIRPFMEARALLVELDGKP